MTYLPQRIEGSGFSSPGSVALIPAGVRLRDDVWVKVKNHLQPAIDRACGVISLEDIMDLHREDKVQLWILQSPGEEVAAVLVTEVLEYRSGSKSMKMLAGGGVGSMAAGFNLLLDTVEGSARETGCKSMIVEGRKGWERVLSDYRFAGIVLEKELN